MKYSFLILLTIILAACSSLHAPQLIAEYPDESAIAIYPKTTFPEHEQSIVYHANLLLDVRQVEKAAENAILLAEHFEGYLVSSRSWIQDNEKIVHLVLAVPAWYFEEMRTELIRLGDLRSEQISGNFPSLDDQEWRQYSYITVQLHPKSTALPRLTLPDWRPIQTFHKAIEVTGAIFAFLLDVIIWILVVLGPFVFLVWLGKRILKNKASSKSNSSD